MESKELMLRACDPKAATQRFVFESNGNLRWAASNETRLCISVAGFDGPAVFLSGCTGGVNEEFVLDGAPGGGTVCTKGGGSDDESHEARCLTAKNGLDPDGDGGIPSGVGMQIWAKPQPMGAVAVLVLSLLFQSTVFR